jgi:hypothetical protein
MKQRKAPAAARIAAACALLDRGWGKPDKIVKADVGSSHELFVEIMRKISAREIPDDLQIE